MTAAPVITWSDQLATGLADVDSQHRRLVEIINVLGNLHARGATAEELLPVFAELRDYTVYHFQHEANLMQSWPVNQANRAAHLKAHQGVIYVSSRTHEAETECFQTRRHPYTVTGVLRSGNSIRLLRSERWRQAVPDSRRSIFPIADAQQAIGVCPDNLLASPR